MTIASPSVVVAALLAFLPLEASPEKGDRGWSSPIADRADFFSQDAERQALAAIEQLQRDEQVEVRIETFDTPPADRAGRVSAMSSRERSEFFANWLQEVAAERQAKGVLILISKEPSHLRVGISKELYRRGFDNEVRNEISERLLRGFRERDFDRGLSDALAYISTAADQQGASGAVSPPAGNRAARRGAPQGQEGMGFGLGGLICVGLIGFVVFMLVRSVLRSFRGPQQVPGGYGHYGHPGYGQSGYGQQPGQYGAPAGGGMFGGLMTGLGGALLGNYLYDRWSGPSGSSGQSRTDPGAGAGPMPDDTNRYQDFTSSGGDFGESSGGDWDAGGGDWGGGDDGGGDF